MRLSMVRHSEQIDPRGEYVDEQSATRTGGLVMLLIAGVAAVWFVLVALTNLRMGIVLGGLNVATLAIGISFDWHFVLQRILQIPGLNRSEYRFPLLLPYTRLHHARRPQP